MHEGGARAVVEFPDGRGKHLATKRGGPQVKLSRMRNGVSHEVSVVVVIRKGHPQAHGRKAVVDRWYNSVSTMGSVVKQPEDEQESGAG